MLGFTVMRFTQSSLKTYFVIHIWSTRKPNFQSLYTYWIP